MPLGLTRRGVDVFAPTDETGTPRSVKNQEAQVWAVEMENLITGAAEGLVRSATLAGLAAGTRVGQPGEVTAGADKGAYTWSGSSWVRVGDLIDPASVQADIDAVTDTVDGLDSKIPDIARQRRSRDRYVAGTAAKQLFFGDQVYSADFVTWVQGFNPPRIVQNPSAYITKLFFQAPGLPVEIGMRIVKRAASIGNGVPGNTEFAWPSQLPGDVIVQPLTWYKLADVMGDADLLVNPQVVRIPVVKGIGALNPDSIYFYQIYARNSLGQYVGIGKLAGRDATVADPAWRRGGASIDATPGAGGFLAATTVSGALYEEVYSEGAGASGVELTDQDPSRVATLNDPDRFDFEQGADPNLWAFYLPATSIDIHPQPLGTSDNGNHFLAFPKVSGANKTRYDVVAMSPDTGLILAGTGSDRELDPNEYLPSNVGFQRIGYMRVHSGGLEFIKTSDFRGYVRNGQEGAFEAHLRRNRTVLPKTMRALRRGLPVNLLVYTDSIHAISNGVTSDYYTPNGNNRDVIGYFNYAADTLAAIPKFDGDGGVGAHVHVGPHWFTKDAIERWGCPVQMLNMGIGGTTSGTGTGPFNDGAPNARNPTRLAALLDQFSPSAANLVLMNFGMNHLADAAIYSDYMALVGAVRAAGGEVLITTCPRPGRRGGAWTSTDFWLYTTKHTIRAAQDLGAAYMDYSQLFGDGNLGSVGLSASTLCDANGGNHPGVYEMKCMGEYSSLIFA
jgi:hypothetical protein